MTRFYLDSLAKLSDEIGCNGYYVFTMNQNEAPMIHGRMFAPAIGRAGTMKVQVKIRNNQPIEVRIIGNAVIAFSTEIML